MGCGGSVSARARAGERDLIERREHVGSVGPARGEGRGVRRGRAPPADVAAPHRRRYRGVLARVHSGHKIRDDDLARGSSLGVIGAGARRRTNRMGERAGQRWATASGYCDGVPPDRCGLRDGGGRAASREGLRGVGIDPRHSGAGRAFYRHRSASRSRRCGRCAAWQTHAADDAWAMDDRP